MSTRNTSMSFKGTSTHNSINQNKKSKEVKELQVVNSVGYYLSIHKYHIISMKIQQPPLKEAALQ